MPRATAAQTLDPAALASEQHRQLVAQIQRNASCIVLNEDIAFNWRSQSFDLEHVQRMTYQCEACGADWKDVPERLAFHLVEHLRTCNAREVVEA